MRAIRGLKGGVASVLTRPILAWEAVLTAFAFRARGSVAISTAYADWRLATAYGSSEHDLDPRDLAAFLRWRRAMRVVSKGARH